MADRYWVGGTAAWDGTAGTKWATTSGGAGGASVPTTADAVFFDAASTGTCTISAGNTGALSINCTGFAGTLTHSAAITVAGSVTLAAGMTFNGASVAFTFTGSGTLTTAGKLFSRVIVDGASVTLTLGDALSFIGGSNVLTNTCVLVQNGATFTTNNYNVTSVEVNNSASFAVGSGCTANLGTSTVTIGSSTPVSLGSTAVLNGTYALVCTSSSMTFAGAGVTFYNVSFTSTNVQTHNVTGANTFNNLTITAPSTAGVRQVTFAANQTFNGALGTTGTAGNRRVWFSSETYGIARTLTCNAAASLTDADFRDLYVVGTAAPISGTRIGDLRGIRGITASTPKTVYWNLAAGGNWSATAWAASSGGAVSTDNHPLAQDTAIIENTGLNTSATVTLDAALQSIGIGTLNMSTRTNAMTLSNPQTGGYTCYGNWLFGSGVTMTGPRPITFSGRNTQTITSNGRSFSDAVTVDSYGGTVELASALTTGAQPFVITNGTFDSKNFTVTCSTFSSNNTNVRTINLGSSTVSTSSGVSFNSTNLTFNAGTSTITASLTGNINGGLTFYNVTLSAPTFGGAIANVNTFNNLTITASATAGLMPLAISANQTINGTLTVAGASPIRRCFIRSDTLGTTRTLTVATLSATDCDFRDITIAGAAAGSSPTRAGDCGGNTGITFPSPKTVYWNLAGTQNWSATGWAPTSGGTVDINQFPLAQDTAVFDNTGAAGTVTIDQAWNIGTVDFSARTSAMTFSAAAQNPRIHGDWKWGTGVTSSSTGGTLTFAKRGTQTITSNGVQFGCNIQVWPSQFSTTETVQLADALSLLSTRTITLTGGTFDAVTFNVTAGFVDWATSGTRTLKMGSGTWTLTGTGLAVWTGGTGLTFFKGTANIVLSDTSATARSFDGGGLSYNKLTIGGATGSSTTTITGNNQFTELASTKTVAHTIALGTTTQTFGKWTVTGTAGNVVTLTGTGTSHVLAGDCTTGIDYLAMGSIGFAATSPGEFYAGANSTGTAGAPVYRTAKPADSTRYWVGGTGNWSDTARWSTGSGGASGASVPRSHDNVVFDAASNATAYTATIDAVTGGVRCKALTIAGPASGNVTLAGSAAIFIHGNVTLPATGLTRTYTGAITLTSNSTGLTFTTNGVTLLSPITVNGEDCSWSLGSALTIANGLTSPVLTVTRGTFDTANFNFTSNSVNGGAWVNISGNITRTVNLGSSTITIAHGAGGGSSYLIDAGDTPTNLTFNAGTSQIIGTNNGAGGLRGGLVFYNVSYTFGGSISGLVGTNTFNNLLFTGVGGTGIVAIPIFTNQTVNGTLTVTAGANATGRVFIRSDTLGTTRTITAAAVSLTDVDFRDITIAGAAAPASGTRIGDCKGNSGITFTAPKTVYWNLAASQNWSATGWATSSGGTPAVNNFPLAQDTAIFNNAGSANAIILDANWNMGTVDMSARTTNVNFSTGTSHSIYGNWINGSGTTWIASTGILTFLGRSSQTLTSAGKTFTPSIFIDSPGGTLTLQDALVIDRSTGGALTLTRGTFDASTYNVTLSGATSSFDLSNSNTRTVAVGSGTWTIAGSNINAWGAATSTNLTVTGTGTVSFTAAGNKTFSGGGVAYTNITLNQGGAGQLTISGNNTFKDITNSYKGTGAATIALAATTQRVSQWTGAGEATRLLTLSGTSAASPATLILTGATKPNVDYLSISNVRAYSLDTTWYAGTNSTNGGTLGWYFQPSQLYLSTGNFFNFF